MLTAPLIWSEDWHHITSYATYSQSLC